MNELTQKEIDRLDYVDNLIYQLFLDIAPLQKLQNNKESNYEVNFY